MTCMFLPNLKKIHIYNFTIGKDGSVFRQGWIWSCVQSDKKISISFTMSFVRQSVVYMSVHPYMRMRLCFYTQTLILLLIII